MTRGYYFEVQRTYMPLIWKRKSVPLTDVRVTVAPVRR